MWACSFTLGMHSDNEGMIWAPVGQFANLPYVASARYGHDLIGLPTSWKGRHPGGRIPAPRYKERLGGCPLRPLKNKGPGFKKMQRMPS